jgi:hypothetical protein
LSAAREARRISKCVAAYFQKNELAKRVLSKIARQGMLGPLQESRNSLASVVAGISRVAHTLGMSGGHKCGLSTAEICFAA